MELVYLWVEDYKNIQKQGFNFSPRFTCNYDGKELTIKENDDYIENFFGDNINVTAIVGKNGSGKSSVLEYLSDSPNNFLRFENNTFITNKNIRLINHTIYPIIIQQEVLEIKYIVSADYLFNNMNTFIEDKSNIKNNSFTEIMQEYATEDLSSYRTLIHNQMNLFLKAKNSLKELKFSKSISIEVEPEDDKKIDEGTLEEHIYMIAYHVFARKCPEYELSNNPLDKYNKLGYLELEKSITADCLEEYEKFKYSCDVFERYDNIKSQKKGYMIRFDIPLNKFNKEIFDFLRLLNEGGDALITLSWDRKFSSGEIAFLNILSYVYDKLSDKNLQYIGIDEGESFLHPNWQKKYLSYIVQFIKDNFPKRKIHIILTSHSPFLLSDIPKQNIIFLDKDENGNCKVVNGLKEKKQTFGANIHTLLSDSFFMEDGLMGEFAKGKIDKAIKLLNQDKLDEKELKYCEQIISIVGEPIVKNQLQRMLDSKRLKKVDEIDAIKQNMIAMQKRLDELEK